MSKSKTTGTKRVCTPKELPQLMSRVGVIKAGMTYELPADIADSLVKYRGCKYADEKPTRSSTKAQRAEKR